MKKTLFISAMLISSFFMFRCDDTQESEIEKPDKNDHEVFTEVLNSLRDMNSQVTNAYQDTTSTGGRVMQDDCLTFSFELISQGQNVPGFGTDYGKIVLAFNGATCNDGVAREGTLEIYFKGWGADRQDSTVAINLSQGGYTLNGYSASNNLPDQSSFFAPTDNVRRNINLTFPDNTVYTFISDEDWTYDNIFSENGKITWTGNSSLITPTGYTIYGNIQESLEAKNTCTPAYKEIVAGTTRLTNNVDGNGLIIDFGDGTCDSAGQVIFDNGETIDYQW